MILEIGKIQQAAAYLAKNINDLYLTKFLKLMYYLDFISVLERGVPVTNDTYYHLPYGPIPTFIKDQTYALIKEWRQNNSKILEISEDELESIFSNHIEIERDTVNNTSILKVKTEVSKNYNYLSEYEIGLLNDIINEYKIKSTSEIVNQTHSEAPYQQTPENNIIDYRLAFYLDRKKILPSRQFVFEPSMSQAEFFNAR